MTPETNTVDIPACLAAMSSFEPPSPTKVQCVAGTPNPSVQRT
jgi:hypothetical protein